jgi:hypothetical protein
MEKLLLTFIFLITLTACSNNAQVNDPKDDLYLEGFVLDKDHDSVDLELLGSSRDISESITVKVMDSKLLKQIDEGESVYVQCDHIEWSKKAETEAIDIYPIGLSDQ